MLNYKLYDGKIHASPLSLNGDRKNEVFGLVIESKGFLITGAAVKKDMHAASSDAGCAVERVLNKIVGLIEELSNDPEKFEGIYGRDIYGFTNTKPIKCGRCGVIFTLSAVRLSDLEPEKKDSVLGVGRNQLPLNRVFSNVLTHVNPSCK